MSEIVEGARVRVTYEGTVTRPPRAPSDYDYAFVRADSGEVYSPNVRHIEVLAPPERQFEDQAYYLHPFGMVYRYDAGRDGFHEPTCRDDFIARDPIYSDILDGFVKLVPVVE